MLTRQEILDNRKKVVAFLQQKGRKKAINLLDAGKGARCCLGHMCYVLEIPREYIEGEGWFYDDVGDFAPSSLLEKVGLWHENGSVKDGARHLVEIDDEEYFSLAYINDTSEWSTRQIGAYLETVIEGGDNTPWKPLAEYPEAEEVQSDD